MVGLSIVLETPKSGSALQVINKVTMMINNKPTSPPGFSSSRNHSPRFSFPVPTFLDQCFFCGQKLLPGKDIYMYKGDRGFCSVECRCRQIFLDEEETLLICCNETNWCFCFCFCFCFC
uniref:FLZ-type domain-containing protein n=1 Tax=Populus trichocarpa TaxID=3694 RepID=A0A2K1YM47_POPTR